MDFVNIPEERVGVLIGPEGKTKREVERRAKVKLNIEENSVSIEGEGFSAWKARDVVQAIGRGFNPDYAFLLFNEDYVFEMLNLKDFASERSWDRLRGRVIGEGGKIRKLLEKESGAFISVYGKTISFIGSFDEVGIAKEAVLMLLNGAKHGSVRRFLEQENKKKSSYRP
ncbi:MAG: RNA-processing protein [Candidatus Altiarchaeales archaeon]|nr:RNA-processing protein [Candidatus Altiarchaeales archaeon]